MSVSVKITKHGKPTLKGRAHDLLCDLGCEASITPENLAKIQAALEDTRREAIEACVEVVNPDPKMFQSDYAEIRADARCRENMAARLREKLGD